MSAERTLELWKAATPFIGCANALRVATEGRTQREAWAACRRREGRTIEAIFEFPFCGRGAQLEAVENVGGAREWLMMYKFQF